MTAETPYATDERDLHRLPLLISFLGAPTIWALHLAASYFLVALDCGSDWNGARTGVLLATLVGGVASAATGIVGWRAWRQSRRVGGEQPLDASRVRQFLVLGGALMAALFTGAIILSGIAPLFVPICG